MPGDREVRAAVLQPIEELHARLVRLSTALADLVSSNDADDEGGPYYDVRVVARRIDRIAGLCRSFLEYEENTEQVFWIELKRRADGSRFARFVSSPLDIRGLMQEAVFEPFASVVFTSATLTVAGSFDFWASRVGLAETTRDWVAVSLPSPFPFRENALLAVPVDAPPPSEVAYRDYLENFLADLLELTEGHGLILFTSFEMLRTAHASVSARLEARGIRCLRQGDEDRARLLEQFTVDTSSVLFATESFWQGVDAPGDALQVVVLCRLPFRVPTDPVLTARMEMIEARGGNAFAELALPEAVMKLRQGFGRLIRRTSDRGIVVVTDVRILTKSYGTLFLDSLPETQRSFTSGNEVLADVERFLYP
jgi:ATP-dependent DNA helicase DinG